MICSAVSSICWLHPTLCLIFILHQEGCGVLIQCWAAVMGGMWANKLKLNPKILLKGELTILDLQHIVDGVSSCQESPSQDQECFWTSLAPECGAVKRSILVQLWLLYFLQKANLVTVICGFVVCILFGLLERTVLEHGPETTADAKCKGKCA